MSPLYAAQARPSVPRFHGILMPCVPTVATCTFLSTRLCTGVCAAKRFEPEDRPPSSPGMPSKRRCTNGSGSCCTSRSPPTRKPSPVRRQTSIQISSARAATTSRVARSADREARRSVVGGARATIGADGPLPGGRGVARCLQPDRGVAFDHRRALVDIDRAGAAGTDGDDVGQGSRRSLSLQRGPVPPGDDARPFEADPSHRDFAAVGDAGNRSRPQSRTGDAVRPSR